MTPVPDGFEGNEAQGLVQQVSESRRVLALDVIELHPSRDREDHTARLARAVILTAAAAQSRLPGRNAERQTVRCCSPTLLIRGDARWYTMIRRVPECPGGATGSGRHPPCGAPRQTDGAGEVRCLGSVVLFSP
jgi:hypothetical protein